MQSAVPPFARPFLFLCLATAIAGWHTATLAAVPPLLLKSSGKLSGPAVKVLPAPGPTHLEADHIAGQEGREVVAEGKVVVRNLRERIEADWLRYDQVEDEVEARGRVVYSQNRDRIESGDLRLKLESRLGSARAVRYEVYAPDGRRSRGGADTLNFAGVDRYELEDATYTSCAAGNDDWLLKMRDLDLDYTRNVGTARHVSVEFLDVPILYAPWMDFSLDNSRKTGFLAPSYGASDERGVELVVPWYWNIAPNRDLTLSPRYMSKRGTQLATDFRYLEKDQEHEYKGDLRWEYLPDDQQAERNRYNVVLQHEHRFRERWSGSLHYERVSDDDYFADLSSLISQTSRVNLPQQGSLSYDGGWWRASGLYQRYQTLQDPDAPVTEPYHRVPQLLLTANRQVPGQSWALFDFAGEFVQFDHRGGDFVQGGRLQAYPSVRMPLKTTYSTITPRLGWHYTRYFLDSDTVNDPDSVAAAAPARGYTDASRSLPVFSLDANLLLERDWLLGEGKYTQTLEPRLFYVNIPYKNQDRMPVFDSALKDLSLDEMFSENKFSGGDRVNDANQLTLALTSRFLDRENGIERLQVTLGQVRYFEDQRVGLTPTTDVNSANTSDVIASISGQLTRQWRVQSGIQYNTSDSDLVRGNIGGAYRDGPGRVFNIDYRYYKDLTNDDNSVNQLDLSAQWPLARRWYGVGRLNYSLQDSRLVEGLAGLEYNAGCWSLRGVLQRLVTTEEKSSNAFYLQLELRGLTKLGPNPLDVLSRSISGYAKSDEFDLAE
ncbi:MAG: LPS-assembly protein [bacterium]|nr:MAG: LPS-assembly protein [bacterium]KAF0149544.1 MAG: LPS-assembly protein [bacterium]KAF0168770.1 MAG: LPS-assembly protein [bacterium]TXT16850.1 MAG: LPS-assembly protein [bacterium]